MYRPSTANRSKPFSVRLSPMPFDEKVAFVHSVCAVLIDSRFGPGRSRPFVIDPPDSPNQDVFYDDMTIGEAVPSYPILADSEEVRRPAAEIIRRETALVNPYNMTVHVRPAHPANLGRGSP